MRRSQRYAAPALGHEVRSIYLKSIDLFGFKTFADRTRLEFQPGISGIVGPNGSGKSNFVDAVRWVLGEQSARQLRGARMDDVIFAGNSQRRSMGMAEVTLTFDNSDGAVPSTFTELAITRRVYRSGESEFFLNKTQVRLRDITDLLLGTGLAAELAAIVSQGEIDAILSAKPEQRRELFEGVAGTSRYRVRKREAQRRLEQTAANALRVNDLLAELEKQIPAIEQQVRRAKRYQKAGQQLRDLEVLSYLRKTSARREERAGIQSELGEDESAAKSSASKDAQLQADLNKARYDEYQASVALDERNAAHAKVAAALAAHASAQAAAQAKIVELSRHSETLEHEVDAAALAESDADSRLSTTSEDLRSSRSLRDDALAASEAAAAAESSATATWETAYAALRSVEDKRTRAAAALAEGTSAINAASAQWQRSLDAAKRIDNERAEVTNSASAARQRRAEAAAAMDAAAADHARARELCETLEREAATINGAREAAQTARDLAHTELVRRESRRMTLSQVDAAGGAGAALLLEAKKSGAATGIIGTIAQHVQAPPQHRVAIDALLAPHAGAVVVGNAADAQRALAMLKGANAPRTTLIVMSSSSTAAAWPQLHGQGVVGAAESVVECEAPLQPVIAALLGGATVVETLSQALGLAAHHPDRIFVTLGGDLVRGASITSGEQRGALSMRAEIEALEAELVTASSALAAHERSLRDVKEQQAGAAKQLAAALERLHASELKRRDLEGLVRQCEREIAEGERRAAQLTASAREAAAEADQMQQAASQHRERAAALQHAMDGLERERTVALQHADGLAVNLNELRAAHRTAAATAAGLVERVAQLGDEVEAARSALVRAQQQRKARAQALVEARAEHAATGVDLERFSHERGIAEKELQNVVASLESARLRRDESARVARELEAAYEEAQQRSRQRYGELERQRIRLAEIDAELALLQESFAQNPASEQECEAIHARHADYEGDADADVRRLREEMLRLGNVNLNALEDRAATMERCEFLRTQMRDLELARGEILASIAEMDAESLRQFNAAFEKVAVAFAETFTRLFNGGNAKMWIAPSEDPTEAGIEISAQPPGKKMQHLNLLSGGERALTAVALIFATLQVRPSPFYIFDEIDAALDEANIGRFGGLLAELASRSQIIIITHNKASMTLVDRMFGITMGEPGVSSILSLALERAGARA